VRPHSRLGDRPKKRQLFTRLADHLTVLATEVERATILQNQLTLRGVHSLTPSNCEEIIELLIEQLRELELNLAAREIADNGEPH
jgi:hypothetical protein